MRQIVGAAGVKTKFAGIAIALTLGLGFSSLPVAPFVIGYAQAADTTLRPAVATPMRDAQNLAKSGKYKQSLAKVKAANAVPGKTAYETYMVNNFLLFLSIQLKDFQAAAQAGEASLATGLVPAKERPQRLLALAQINYRAKNFAKTITFAKQYEQVAGSNAELDRLVAQAHFLSGDYPRAQVAAKAIAMSGGKADETMLQLWHSAAFRQHDRKGQREALTALVAVNPKPSYLSDLLDMVQADLGRSDRMSFEIAQLRLAGGFLGTSDEYVEMAQLAIQLGLPGVARRVMEKGFTNKTLGGAKKSRELRLLAMAEAQIAQKEPKLAVNASAPEAKADLGEAYASYGKTAKAITLYKEALAMPFAQADLARLHLGQSYLASGDADAARRAFTGVRDPKLVQLAKLWIAISR